MRQCHLASVVSSSSFLVFDSPLDSRNSADILLGQEPLHKNLRVVLLLPGIDIMKGWRRQPTCSLFYHSVHPLCFLVAVSIHSASALVSDKEWNTSAFFNKDGPLNTSVSLEKSSVSGGGSAVLCVVPEVGVCWLLDIGDAPCSVEGWDVSCRVWLWDRVIEVSCWLMGTAVCCRFGGETVVNRHALGITSCNELNNSSAGIKGDSWGPEITCFLCFFLAGLQGSSGIVDLCARLGCLGLTNWILLTRAGETW